MQRNKLFFLVVSITLLSVGWSIFWFVRANITESIVQSYLDNEYDDWDFDYSDISIRGFPNRTDLRIHDLRITNRYNATDLMLGNLNILSLVYNWNEFIVVFAPLQSVVIGGVEYIVDSDYPRSSLSLNNRSGLPLNSFITEINQTSVTSSKETNLNLDSGLFAIKPDETNPNKFLVHLNLDNIALSNTRTQLTLEPFDFLVNGEVQFSGADTSQCISVEEVNLSSVNFNFNEFGLHLKGELKNEFGLPNGSLLINLEGKKVKFFELLVTSGLLSGTQFAVISRLPIDSFEIQIVDGSMNFMNLVDIKVFDSFPEFC
ncbi:MAG: DUF2125 domain-containing protein [Paracoccaceae bacterium]|nr:DUF2125 domain-containing protein [Paracoccaceae bacterium]MDE2676239.1 DUF2125 domain-containing protein [Paracoccaceae bacterium]